MRVTNPKTGIPLPTKGDVAVVATYFLLSVLVVVFDVGVRLGIDLSWLVPAIANFNGRYYPGGMENFSAIWLLMVPLLLAHFALCTKSASRMGVITALTTSILAMLVFMFFSFIGPEWAEGSGRRNVVRSISRLFLMGVGNPALMVLTINVFMTAVFTVAIYGFSAAIRALVISPKLYDED